MLFRRLAEANLASTGGPHPLCEEKSARDDEGVIASSPRDESVRLADTRAVWAP
jgi:hypothetical protein